MAWIARAALHQRKIGFASRTAGGLLHRGLRYRERLPPHEIDIRTFGALDQFAPQESLLMREKLALQPFGCVQQGRLVRACPEAKRGPFQDVIGHDVQLLVKHAHSLWKNTPFYDL